MLVTLLGIVTLVRLFHANAVSPIVVITFGIVTLIKWQPKKARSPMLVTGFPLMLDGILRFLVGVMRLLIVIVDPVSVKLNKDQPVPEMIAEVLHPVIPKTWITPP